MGYMIYERNGRDCGYGVPAWCDQPDCWKKIDRGLGYLCGQEPGGDEHGCGLYFCGQHSFFAYPEDHDEPVEEFLGARCQQCMDGKDPFEPKPDHPEWILWKLNHDSWAQWREQNADWMVNTRIKIAAARLTCGDGCRGCLACTQDPTVEPEWPDEEEQPYGFVNLGSSDETEVSQVNEFEPVK